MRHASATLRAATEGLSPAYFAMVMATGIVSIAAFMLGITGIDIALFAINIAAYVVLMALTVLRIIWFPRALLSDLADHQRGPGFFTIVAGSGVLGSQFVLIAGNYGIALALWIVALILWVVFIYGIFAVLSVKENKPSLADGINGGWLLAVVSTQSIAVLGALIAAHWPQPYRLELNFLALSMWLWGGMLYIWMIALIFYRYTFFEFSPGDLSPPYWINMGAMAISTLAGSLLIINTPDAPYLRSLLPFLRGSPFSIGRPAPGGYRCSWCWGFGAMSSSDFRSPTIRNIGERCFRLACIRSQRVQMAQRHESPISPGHSELLCLHRPAFLARHICRASGRDRARLDTSGIAKGRRGPLNPEQVDGEMKSRS